MRGALVVVAAATLTLAACGSKSADGGSSNANAGGGGTTQTTETGSAGGGAAGSAAGGGDSSAASGGGSAAASGGGTASGGATAIKPVEQISPEGAKVEQKSASNAANPAGDGKAKCSGVNIGMAGALTGANAALGINILNGAKVAIDEHNKANPDCQVQIKQFDTEGDPQKATQVAPSIVNDKTVVGLLGPAFSGETKATEPIFSQAGLLSLTASATNPDLTKQGWKNFFRGLGNDNSQGGAIANYMTKELGYKKICVVQDDSDYGVGLAKVVTETLGDAADSSCAAKVKTGDKDFSATVNQIKGASPDAVYYAGYYAEAAPFVSQLRGADVKATFVSADGTNDPQFVKQAGNAASGAILTCPCGPAPADFAKKYQDLNKIAPGVYSVDAYDLTTIMLKGIDSGITDRAKLIDYVKSYEGQGLAKDYKWDDTGELAVANPWVYKVG
ncbi:branched-chain amino acid ABC transporter substrate-binding protein [Nakamurella aerolata]|uniref:Branched-chain amino acid ABC transporter substrate-binding protein n=1 Tax=Nakamurella aerolata TaxID=1656892 RepID=A0A849ACC8_9ACTN|nr:branched-chain amino acid ABC transporter substrate-binding protein [Nakamurella aerolata]NNG34532.1 branched-chain amino acid ABC transporter substrate-binding protein [Nakamurella aerolata]